MPEVFLDGRLLVVEGEEDRVLNWTTPPVRVSNHNTALREEPPQPTGDSGMANLTSLKPPPQEFNKSGTYVVPDGVTVVTIRACGGGGGGGGGTIRGFSRGGGGGGGAPVVETTIPIKPYEKEIDVTIGKGGAGGECGSAANKLGPKAGDRGGDTLFGKILMRGGNGGGSGAGNAGGASITGSLTVRMEARAIRELPSFRAEPGALGTQSR
jgi:hypothetical protein